MAKVIKIIEYQFRKMREQMARDREELKQRHAERMKETESITQRIRDQRAEFERRWFKLLKGGID
jgi:hypothetical protein